MHWSETYVSNPNTSFFVHATPPLVNSNRFSWENQLFAYAKTKVQISFAVTAKLISAFVIATWIVNSLYFLNPKFQASNHLLWLYSPVCVGPRWKHWRPVFSQQGSTVVQIRDHASETCFISFKLAKEIRCGFYNIWWWLSEAILMSTHNIGFFEEITRLSLNYHQIHNLSLLSWNILALY